MKRIILVVLAILVLISTAGCLSDEQEMTIRERELYAERALVEEMRQMEGASADSYIRKVTADTDAYERRVNMELDAAMTRMQDHLLMLENLETALRHTSDSIVPLGENAQAAAENSWWSNVLLIVLACAFVGLTGLVVLVGIRMERQMTYIMQKLEPEENKENGADRIHDNQK